MHNSKNKYGFSLIEIMVSIVVGTFLVYTIITMQNMISSNQQGIGYNVISITEANTATQTITREIRNAKQSVAGSFPLALANDTEIIFFADIDDDSGIEKVRYYLQGDNLIKGVTEPTGYPPIYNQTEKTTLVITNVTTQSQPIFRYYNGDWPTDTQNNPLPSPARLIDTKFVTISITINPQPSKPQYNYYLESSAQIRALKNN